MKFPLKTLLLFTSFLIGICLPESLPAQSPTKEPGIPLAEALKISPLPPTSVKLHKENTRVTVTWKKNPSERVVAYEVYRSVGDGKFEKIGTTKDPRFIDEKAAAGKSEYAVASVDYAGNRSDLRKAELDAEKGRQN